MQEVEVKIVPMEECGGSDASKLCLTAVEGSKLTCQVSDVIAALKLINKLYFILFFK